MCNDDTVHRILCALTKVMASAVLIIGFSPSMAQLNTGIARSVGWNSANTKIAVGHDTGLVEIIEAATGQRMATFQLPYVLDLAWSPHDNDLLAVATSDRSTGAIHVLNTATGQEITTLIGEQQIYSVTWKPDGSQIAGAVGYITSPGLSRYIKLWNTATWEVSNTIITGTLQILSLDWSPDGAYIAGGEIDGKIRIWDVDTGADVSTLYGHTVAAYAVAWSPDGLRLASASSLEDPTIRIWDSATGQSLLVIPDSGAFDITWSPDGQRIAAARIGNIVYVWDTFTGQQVNVITRPDTIYAVAWSSEGNKVVLGDNSGGAPIILLPTADAGPDQTLIADASGSATLTLDGSASFDPDGEIVSYVWTLDDVEIATGAIAQVQLSVGVHAIMLTVTGTDGATASDTVTITVVAASTPTPTATITPTDTPTATLTPTLTPTPSQVCDFNVAAGDALGLVNAINAANNNGASADTICLEEGTYTFASASNSIALPSVITPITIVGNSAIIERGSGAPNFRLFNVTSSGALILEDMTLRNGNASGSNGGAILNAGSLTLNGVTLENNTARFGGGIHSSGTLTISDSTLATNSAVEDGGMIYVNSGTLTLSDTTLEENSARYGSGVYLNNGTADLTGMIARANHATEQGAGVYQRTGTLTISGGLFENNTARFGNGVYVDAGTATISDVTMRENVAVEEGAGIYNRTGSVSVTDSVFEDNQARYGAAISNRGTVSVAGSAFTGNSVQESGGAVYTTRSTSGNQVHQSCFEGNTARFGGAVFSSASGFNARNNWWGAATGPTSAMVNANVLTEPFLTDGCPQ